MKIVCILLLLVCTGLLTTSCVKDKQPPVIEIIKPLDNDTLSLINSNFLIQFKATDETDLSKEFLSISDNEGNVLTTESRKIYGTVYNYTNSISFNGTQGKVKNLILTIKIEDSEKNSTTKSILFNVKL